MRLSILLLLKAIVISSEQHYFTRNKSSLLTTESSDSFHLISMDVIIATPKQCIFILFLLMILFEILSRVTSSLEHCIIKVCFFTLSYLMIS